MSESSSPAALLVSRSQSLVDAAADDGLRPEPALTVSEWADQHRILSGKAASEAGPWRTDRTPYLRDIMDALSVTSPAQRIVFMKGAQIGATEAGVNWIGYVIHHAPGPMLVVWPTVDMGKRNSKQRIAPLVEETPALRAIVKEARSRDSGNTLLSKEFPGGILVITGANSSVGLRSMPVRFLFLDEADAYPGDVDGEGDPIALAESRTRTFRQRRKIFIPSTPTIAGRSRVEREYLRSDQRRYFVPCPHCKSMQLLRFPQLRWPKGEPHKAEYQCEACSQPIGEQHKTEMLRRGQWRATATGDGRTIGFHLSSLYSPVGWMSWGEIAEKFLAAQGDAELMKEFVNTVLGETWQARGDAPEWQDVYRRRDTYRSGTVPRGTLILFGGVDVQKDRLEVGVWGSAATGSAG
jgi:phage terminase large subunit GpA-like protein